MSDGDDRFTNRLIFLHGFTQTHHHWHDVAHRIAERLGTEPTLAFVDLPGHGLAATDLDGDIASSGPRLAELAGPGTYVGYSMGGRMALTAAIARPDLVERLVVIGATPGIADDAERTERRRLDDRRAEQIEANGVAAFLDEWLAAPLFSTLPADRRGLERRRRNTVAGLAHSLRCYGTGVQAPLWDALSGLAAPTLVVAGELDTKFTAIGNRMADALGHARFRTVADAGHAAHTERPAETAELIAGWIGQPSGQPSDQPGDQPSANPTDNNTP